MSITHLDTLRSTWAPRLQAVLADNLLCAFAHGDCLMPGFDPAKSPWLLSLWLKDNSPLALTPLAPLAADLAKEKVHLGYFLTSEVFASSADVFPLEYLHMAKRHAILLGGCALEGFAPAPVHLRHELERELRGLLLHTRRHYLYALAAPKTLGAFLQASLAQALPLLYGAAWLFTGTYPADHPAALEQLATCTGLDPVFARIQRQDLPSAPAEAISLANNYILGLQKLVTTIDQLETAP